EEDAVALRGRDLPHAQHEVDTGDSLRKLWSEQATRPDDGLAVSVGDGAGLDDVAQLRVAPGRDDLRGVDGDVLVGLACGDELAGGRDGLLHGEDVHRNPADANPPSACRARGGISGAGLPRCHQPSLPYRTSRHTVLTVRPRWV